MVHPVKVMGYSVYSWGSGILSFTPIFCPRSDSKSGDGTPFYGWVTPLLTRWQCLSGSGRMEDLRTRSSPWKRVGTHPYGWYKRLGTGFPTYTEPSYGILSWWMVREGSPLVLLLQWLRGVRLFIRVWKYFCKVSLNISLSCRTRPLYPNWNLYPESYLR